MKVEDFDAASMREFLRGLGAGALLGAYSDAEIAAAAAGGARSDGLTAALVHAGASAGACLGALPVEEVAARMVPAPQDDNARMVLLAAGCVLFLAGGLLLRRVYRQWIGVH